MTRDLAIEIICDGGPAYGLGHLLRSAALGRVLKQRGHRVRLVVPSGEKIAPLSDAPNDDGEPSLHIIDLPYDAGDFVRNARALGVGVLALDYHGDAAPDLSICLFDDSGVPAEGRRAVGLDYAIIRPEIAEYGLCPQGDGVLVMIGGGDLRNQGPAAARDLAAKGNHVTLIRGPLCSDRTGEDGYVTLTNPDDLAKRMAGCAWAVSNGGTSMLEFMNLGKAVQVIPQTKQEQRFAEGILARGGLLGVAADTLDIPDEADRRRVGKMAGSLVDGRGLNRFADAAEELLS